MTIKEVSNKYHIGIEALRYYERIGVIPHVNRNANGIRDYTEQDCEWVYFTKCMRTAGISIETLIHYVSLFQHGNSIIKARKNILMEQRDMLVERMDEMNQILKCLNNRIDGYEDGIAEFEKKIKKVGYKLL